MTYNVFGGTLSLTQSINVHRRPGAVHSPCDLAAAISMCANQQFGTNFHSICDAQTTLGNSLNVVLRAGYVSVGMAGGASDRH